MPNLFVDHRIFLSVDFLLARPGPSIPPISCICALHYYASVFLLKVLQIWLF